MKGENGGYVCILDISRVRWLLLDWMLQIVQDVLMLPHVKGMRL